MLRNTVDRHDVRQVDLCGSLVRELDLGLLCSLLESLECHRVFPEVDTVVLCCEFGCKPVDDLLVEIITSEVGVAIGGLHFEHTAAELEDGDIEGTATEVIDSDLHVLVLLVKTIGESCCGRLVDDSLDIETCDLAGFLGCLTL